MIMTLTPFDADNKLDSRTNPSKGEKMILSRTPLCYLWDQLHVQEPNKTTFTIEFSHSRGSEVNCADSKATIDQKIYNLSQLKLHDGIN